MKRLLTPLIALLLVGVLVAYMFTFQVRYDQVAVVTTFGAAEKPVILSRTVRSVATVPANGVLPTDATFSLQVTGVEAPVQVTVTADATKDNAEQTQPLEALRADLREALDGTPLANLVDVRVQGTRLLLSLRARGGEALNAGDVTLSVAEADETASAYLFQKVTPSPGSMITEPGLYLQLPPPIQRVWFYPKSLQMLEDQFEELQTADNNAVIMKMSLFWRIEDPYTFFSTHQTVEAAEASLRSYLRSLRRIVSEYRFDQLVNTDVSKLKMDEIERRMAVQLQLDLDAATETGFGIRVEQVGLQRLVLPEKTTEKVQERMKSTREALAESARAEGQEQASTIRTNADTARTRILDFARGIAQRIRAEGDRDAARAYAEFAKDEDFAIFLRELEGLKTALGNNAKFIFKRTDFFFERLFKAPEVEGGR